MSKFNHSFSKEKTNYKEKGQVGYTKLETMQYDQFP